MDAQYDTTCCLVANAIQRDRSRLVSLCAQLTGNWEIAEDLAQESLAIAWAQVDTLRNPLAVSAWLTGIARNVCRQWVRQQQRERRHAVPLDLDDLPSATDPTELTRELERDELGELLRQALTTLPSETRRLLLARLFDEASYQVLADQFGLRESTAMVRLHRAKRRLRQLLVDHCFPEISVYDLLGRTPTAPETFDLFCPLCGHARLVGRFDAASGALVLRCPVCQAGRTETVANAIDPMTMATAKGATSTEEALYRVMQRIYDHYAAAATSTTTTCLHCGAALPLRRQGAHAPAALDAPAWFRRSRGFYTRCPVCGKASAMGLRSLARCSSPGRQFWARHPRMRTLPGRDITYHGRPAVLITLESLDDASRLDLVFARENYQLLGHDA